MSILQLAPLVYSLTLLVNIPKVYANNELICKGLFDQELDPNDFKLSQQIKAEVGTLGEELEATIQNLTDSILETRTAVGNMHAVHSIQYANRVLNQSIDELFRVLIVAAINNAKEQLMPTYPEVTFENPVTNSVMERVARELDQTTHRNFLHLSVANRTRNTLGEIVSYLNSRLSVLSERIDTERSTLAKTLIETDDLKFQLESILELLDRDQKSIEIAIGRLEAERDAEQTQLFLLVIKSQSSAFATTENQPQGLASTIANIETQMVLLKSVNQQLLQRVPAILERATLLLEDLSLRYYGQ